MTQESYTTIILTAAEGQFLTQFDSEIEPKDRIIATQIALGKHDTADNWMEITKEEADELLAEIEAARQEDNDEKKA